MQVHMHPNTHLSLKFSVYPGQEFMIRYIPYSQNLMNHETDLCKLHHGEGNIRLVSMMSGSSEGISIPDWSGGDIPDEMTHKMEVLQ